MMSSLKSAKKYWPKKSQDKTVLQEKGKIQVDLPIKRKEHYPQIDKHMIIKF